MKRRLAALGRYKGLHGDKPGLEVLAQNGVDFGQQSSGDGFISLDDDDGDAAGAQSSHVHEGDIDIVFTQERSQCPDDARFVPVP